MGFNLSSALTTELHRLTDCYIRDHDEKNDRSEDWNKFLIDLKN